MSWFGRIVFTREGIVREHEFSSKELAEAYKMGADDMKEQYDFGDGEEGCLEDMVAVASDLPSEEE